MPKKKYKMEKITTFPLSSIFLHRTFASKSLHVRITLFLIILGSFGSYALAGIQEKQPLPKMVEKSTLIIRGKVVSTESQWKEDSRGRHIYTGVTIKISDKIKGNIKNSILIFEVVGGTVDNIREVVSDTPSFEINEDVIVFLSGYPLTILHGFGGKIPVYDGKIYWDNLEITADSFMQALKILEQDPNASVNLEKEYQAPTASPASAPSIINISPDKASAGTDTQVTITGTNFGSTQGSSKVEFFYRSGQPKIQASIVSWSDTQIVCKVPIGNVGGYPASAGSGPVTVTTSGGTSSGYNFKVTFGYGQVKWSGTAPTVSYRINENTQDCTGEGAAVQTAANTWDNTNANLTFLYGGTHTHTTASQNGDNEILWGSAPGSIATNYYWSSGTEIFECDIVFNDNDYVWSTSGTPPSGQMDVETIAVHELGHWLNLRDLYGDLGDGEYDTAKVMYGFGSSGAVKRNLHTDDTAGVVYIYPTPSNYSPILSNPDVIPNSGTTATTFEFLVDYYDADGDPPDPIYRKVYISGTGGQAEGIMSLKSGSPANGTYYYTRTLPQGSYSYMFFFADNKGASDIIGWYAGPNVYSSSDAVINIVIQCTRISSDLRLKYSLTGSGGPWTDIPITKQILDPLAVPAGSTVWFQADVASPNYEYRGWEGYENGVKFGEGGPSNSLWSVSLGTNTSEIGLNVFYRYTPQYYTISGTVTQNGGALVPGGVNLTLTSDVQTLSQHTDNGSFSFSSVQGGASVTITPSANGYEFSPANLVYNNLKDNFTGQTITAYASDNYVPMTSFLTVPPAVSESSSISFTWTGSDNVTSPANLQYQCKLDGVDIDWSAWSSGTSKSYDVNNGTYTFWVRAKDEAGNINQSPISYKFVINAAPKIISVERISNSVWASRITLQMPPGATHPTNMFVLLPVHSVMNDSELIPVRIHYADDVNACGANTIVAAQLGLTVRITQAGTGWLVTLPQSIPSGQTVQYDIVWGKIRYFGWQDFVSIPLNFPNVGQLYTGDYQCFNVIQNWYLDSSLRLWRFATKYRSFTGNIGDCKAWAFMNASDSHGPVVNETILRYSPGHPFDGSIGYSILYNYGAFIDFGTKINLLWNDNKDTWNGTKNYYYRRYALQAIDAGGSFLNSRESEYVDRYSVIFPQQTYFSKTWLIGSVDASTTSGVNSLWYSVLNSDGTEIIPRTEIETLQRPNGSYFSDKATSAIGENVLLLWSRNWNTILDRERAELVYQIRNSSGTLVKATANLTPALLPDSTNKSDRYGLQYMVSDKHGKVWISYTHWQSGHPTQQFYVILGTDGTIWKGPIPTNNIRTLHFCDKDGYIWATEGTQNIILYPDDTIAFLPEAMPYIPKQAVGTMAATVDPDSYRLYDRWSPQLVQIDVPSCANRNMMELFDLNLWANNLHPSNVNLKKGDTTIWSQSGQFTGHTTVNMTGVLNEGQNLLVMTQNDFLGGQVLVTFPYVLSITGDITGNGIVDFEDLKILADQWLQPPGNPSADIAPSPVDGIVNFLDFAVLAEGWL